MTRLAKRSTFLLLSCLCLLAPRALRAADGGSIYSRFGLGDIRYGYSAQSLGMAGAGIAVRSASNIDATNPAAWSSIVRTRYTISALYEGYSSNDGKTTAFLSSADFNGAMIAVPISPKSGIVFAGGITPMSRVNYNAVAPASNSGLDYSLRFLGSGGVSTAHAGLSASLTDDLHAGLKYQYYFGTLRHTVQQNFTTSAYTNAEVIRSTTLRGSGVTLGLIYSGLGRLLRLAETEHLSIGAYFSSAASLSTDQDDYFSYAAGGLTTRDTSAVAHGQDHLPTAFGGGLSYTTDRLTLAADLQYQNWNAFTSDGAHPTELRDSYRYSAGIELLPKHDPTAPFTQRMGYRAGVFYHQTYYQIGGQGINEFGVSAGTGLPIFGDTRLHIGAEYAMRGTNDYQLQKDNILRLSFTISGGELWFVRPQEE